MVVDVKLGGLAAQGQPAGHAVPVQQIIDGPAALRTVLLGKHRQ